MQAFCSKQEFDKMKVICDKNTSKDLYNLIENIPLFKNISVIEKDVVDQNTINGHELTPYVKKRGMPFTKCKLGLQKFEVPQKFKDKRYIFVDEYYGDSSLPALEKCAIENDFLLLNLSAFKKSVKNSLVDKTKYTFTEKLAILQNAIGYLGYDYSLLSSVADKYKARKNVGIIATTSLTLPELFFKFYPSDNFGHFYNKIDDYLNTFNLWQKELKN